MQYLGFERMKVDENCTKDVLLGLIHLDQRSLLSTMFALKYNKIEHLPNNLRHSVVTISYQDYVTILKNRLNIVSKTTLHIQVTTCPIGNSEKERKISTCLLNRHVRVTVHYKLLHIKSDWTMLDHLFWKKSLTLPMSFQWH